MVKRFLADYLNFTRKERVGITALLISIILLLILPFFFPYFLSEPKYDHHQFEKEIASLNIKQQDTNLSYTKRDFDDNNYHPRDISNYSKSIKGELFYFDPNTLPANGWVKLGIREKTANTIQNYISKGGRFYKPEDISKIWGLHEDEVKRLLPYVRIEPMPAKDYNKYPDSEKGKIYEKPTYTITTVDINNADTTAFIALPGIGSKLAARIIAFREKLGGFYKTEQIAETYGLPDSVFQKIKSKLVITGSNVKQFNINTATVDELKTHPYLRYNIANAVVQYRLQHGSFSSVSDIKNIMLITDEVYNKAAPYLTVK